MHEKFAKTMNETFDENKSLLSREKRKLERNVGSNEKLIETLNQISSQMQYISSLKW